MRRLRQILIFIVGLSIPFNNVAFSFAGRNWSVGLISSALYFLVMLSDFPKFPRIASSGKYVFNTLWFAILLTFINLLNENFYNTPIIPITLFMCCFLMYAMLLHDTLDKGVVRQCIYGMGVGCILMAILFLCGVGVELGDDNRLQMFGENSNTLGIYSCVGNIIMFNDWILKDGLKLKKIRFMLLIAYIPLVVLLFATGSRVAFLAYVLSFVLSVVFFRPKAMRRKIIVVLMAVLVCFVLYNISQSSDFVLFQRLLSTAEEGDLSGRDTILTSLKPYIIQHIFGGVGQTGYVEISYDALGYVLSNGGTVYGESPHNVLVEILLYTGILGLLLYLIFWYKVFACSILKFRESADILPVLLLIPIAGCVLSGQILGAKWAFIIYAYIITSVSRRDLSYYELASTKIPTK